MIEPNGNKRGTIYTFYSFKGGVGRSMALANVAALLTKWGYSVLVVDWDVEAPGLERFFLDCNPAIAEQRTTKPGIMDLMQATGEGRHLAWRDCLIKVRIGSDAGSLSLLSAGRSGNDYTGRLHALNFPELFEKYDLGSYIEQLRDEWASEFQFVLIDSRTGVTDIGGICTVHMADTLVLFFTTTESSTDGAFEVLERARRAQAGLPRDRQRLLAIPVPAKDESRTEYQRAADWKEKFAERFAEVYRDWLPTGVQPREAIERLRIPYVPYWSFGERLPVIEEGTRDPSSLGYSYQILARVLANRLDWDKALEGQEPIPPPIAKPHRLDPHWLSRHSLRAQERLLAAGLPAFMEIAHSCVDSEVDKDQRELLAASRQAQVLLTGRPIGLVKDGSDQFSPFPTNDGILAIIDDRLPNSTFPRHTFDYWTLNKSGDFYTLRSLTEDQLDRDRPLSEIWFEMRVTNSVETLVHCKNLYRAIGVEPNSQVELSVRYSGLRGRRLTSRNLKWLDYVGARETHESEVKISLVRFRLGAVDDDRLSLVKQLCAPLFVLFDYAAFDDDLYEQVITDSLKGHVGSRVLGQRS